MSSCSKTVQDGRSVVFMFPQMSVQIGLLSKTSFTEVTFVGLLLVVDVSHVTLEVRRYREGSLTELAFVGLLSCVCPDVSRQVGGPRETFTTKLALIFLLWRGERRRLGLEGVLVELQG